ncbi:hypothetical protein [Lentzea flava]|uniref:hypothetical protein n=1 Tax=Lentzea flava TaxID=103732 RepID=UPI001E33B878|nr:hypothetical protein [Lentzea flava]
MAEETGLVLASLGRKLWIRESRFHDKGRDHHRVDHVFLGRIMDTAPESRSSPPRTRRRD